MDFKDTNIAETSKRLSLEERREWQAIYASHQNGTVMSGNIVGVDLHEMNIIPEGKKRPVPTQVRCLIVIKYRVKIIIPETEVFDIDLATGYHILHSMCGAGIDFVITHVDREAGFAVASRKLALERLRDQNNGRHPEVGQLVDVQVLSVGRGICTVTYRGYDVRLPQREVCYNAVSDLREVLQPGDIRKAVVKGFDEETGTLQLSIKETTPHPFDGVETRHPIGSTRIATVSGKYSGGIFCRLYDGATDVLCSYLSMEYDTDHQIGDKVEVVVKKYNYDKKMIYGKIIRKMGKR